MRRALRYLPHGLGALSVLLLVWTGVHGFTGWKARREGRGYQRDLASIEARVRQLRIEAARPEIEISGTGLEARWVLPARAGRLALVHALENAAAGTQVEITGMGLPEHAGPDRVDATVVAHGPPHALIQFLRAVEDLRKILVVGSARMYVDLEGRVWLTTRILSHGRALPRQAAAKGGSGAPDHG